MCEGGTFRVQLPVCRTELLATHAEWSIHRYGSLLCV